MNTKLIKQLLLYSLPILAYVVFTYTAQPFLQEQNTARPTINIIEYPNSGPDSAAQAGYIAAYYAFQKLGLPIVDNRQAFLLSNKNMVKKNRLLQAAQTQARTDLQDFITKKPAPVTSPIEGVSPTIFKDIILTALPEIATIIAQDFISKNFDASTGQLKDDAVTMSGTNLFNYIVSFLRNHQQQIQAQYNITWMVLEKALTADEFKGLKEFTGLRQASILSISKKEVLATLHRLFPSEESTDATAEATGYWLRPEELAALINANTQDVDKVTILSDLGLLKTPSDGTDRTQEIVGIFDRIKRKMAASAQGTQTFIIDKAYVRGKPEQPHLWVPIIVNKQGTQLRLALIDPENQIKDDNEYLKILLDHLS